MTGGGVWCGVAVGGVVRVFRCVGVWWAGVWG